jgi:hypothetical protein
MKALESSLREVQNKAKAQLAENIKKTQMGFDLTSALFCILERLAAAESDLVRMFCDVAEKLKRKQRKQAGSSSEQLLSQSVSHSDSSQRSSLIFQALNYNSPDFVMMNALINVGAKTASAAATAAAAAASSSKKSPSPSSADRSETSSKLLPPAIADGLELVKLYRVYVSSASTRAGTDRINGVSTSINLRGSPDTRKKSKSEDDDYDDDTFYEESEGGQQQQTRDAHTSDALTRLQRADSRKKDRNALLNLLARGVGQEPVAESRIRVFTVMTVEQLRSVLSKGWEAWEHSCVFFTDAAVAAALFGSLGNSFEYTFDVTEDLSGGAAGGGNDDVAESSANSSSSPMQKGKSTRPAETPTSSMTSLAQTPLLQAALKKHIYLLVCCSVDPQELGLQSIAQIQQMQQQLIEEGKARNAELSSRTQSRRGSGSGSGGLEKISVPLESASARRDFVSHFMGAQRPTMMQVENGTGEWIVASSSNCIQCSIYRRRLRLYSQ